MSCPRAVLIREEACVCEMCTLYGGVVKKCRYTEVLLRSVDCQTSTVHNLLFCLLQAHPDHDTLFYLRSEENNFLTLASFKYYLLCPYDMFLAIRNNGCMRSPHQSVPGQDSTQLILVPVT